MKVTLVNSGLGRKKNQRETLILWARPTLTPIGRANIDNLAITIVDDVMTLAGIVDDPTVHDNLITAAQQVAGDPSHVIDETSGANRTVTTEPPVVTEPSAPAVSVPVTTPLTTPAVVPVTAAPVPTPRVTAAPRPTTARVSRSSRSTSSPRTSVNRATVRVAKASSAVRAVRPTKPVPTTTDGFVTQGGADVPDTTLVEEPPVAAPDAEADTAAASASTRDQVRAAIAGASIDFSEGSAELTDASRAVVGRIAAALVASTVRIEVRAYTDDRGDEQVNRALTQRRANVVRAELVAQGVDGARVSAVGLGAANSLASDDTADGRRRNRRVVFAIFGQ